MTAFARLPKDIDAEAFKAALAASAENCFYCKACLINAEANDWIGFTPEPYHADGSSMFPAHGKLRHVELCEVIDAARARPEDPPEPEPDPPSPPDPEPKPEPEPFDFETEESP